MAENTIDDFLNTPLNTIEKPAILPPGTYIGAITKWESRSRKIQDRDVNFIMLSVKVLSAEEDVDPELLARVDLSTTFVYPEFEMSDKGKYAFRQLMAGLFDDGGDSKASEYLAVIAGKTVVFKAAHRPGKQPDQNGEIPMFLNISNLKAA